MTVENLSGFYIYHKTHIMTQSPTHRPPIIRSKWVVPYSSQMKGLLNKWVQYTINQQTNVSAYEVNGVIHEWVRVEQV